ncbi:CDGSH iron-sulfur domain-containing protein [Puerhibacterium puerhi]|uniref:CDGSH iron-sulfur domain-containing protein n=1 Tax=Puerhibacterium puerhi TaxID=2692623 RepID=UPI00135C6502|nr:CDGSH iron-sulfur domain-containing protein [Puerhibacterium puerhi]
MATTTVCPAVARWVSDWTGPLGHRLAEEEAGDDARAGARAEVSLTPCPDGPLLVRGPVTVVGPDGEEVPRHRATVAMCRCGGTAIPPWCDGTHKVNGFRSDD